MTTTEIKDIDKARAANAVTAKSVIDRAKALADAVAERDEAMKLDIRYAEITRRAIERQHLDELAVLDEEIGQVAFMLGTPLPGEDDEPGTDGLLKPEDAPTAPAGGAVAEADKPDAPTTAAAAVPPVDPPKPELEPTEKLGFGKVQDVTKKPRRNAWVVFTGLFKNWHKIAWWTASILGALTLIILFAAYDGFFPTRPDAVRIIAIIIIVIAFFFLGGWIGSIIDRRQLSKPAKVLMAQIPVPAATDPALAAVDVPEYNNGTQ